MILPVECISIINLPLTLDIAALSLCEKDLCYLHAFIIAIVRRRRSDTVLDNMENFRAKMGYYRLPISRHRPNILSKNWNFRSSGRVL